MGYGIAMDSARSAYVTGYTLSADFPTPNAIQATSGGGQDAFVSKLNPAGSALSYSTYLGGSESDAGQAIDVDSTGNAHVIGITSSADFPTVNAEQVTFGGDSDSFVAMLGLPLPPPTPTHTPTSTPTRTATSTATNTPTRTATRTPTSTNTPVPSPTQTATEDPYPAPPTDTPEPTATEAPVPTDEPYPGPNSIEPTTSAGGSSPAGILNIYMPLVRGGNPRPTRSRYIYTAVTGGNTTNKFYKMGEDAAANHPSGIVILDFGWAYVNNNIYGTQLFDPNLFMSLADTEYYVKQFILGYLYTTRQPGSFLRVAIGTSNRGDYVTNEHGRQWTLMVNRLDNYIALGQAENAISVAGAIDIEPGYGPPTSAKSWIHGYDNGNQRELYNFGSCEGCPYDRPDGTPAPWGLANGWLREDLWQVSWGLSSNASDSSVSIYPLPQIYATSGANAAQWYQLSLFGLENHEDIPKIDFRGVLTQADACRTNGPCSGTNNRPEAGYTQLYDKLDSDPRTRQIIDWSTDISWVN